jgi:hypothetical protein
MIDLETIARRWGLSIDGTAIVCGLARISRIDGSDDLAVSTCDPSTAQVLDDSGIGQVLFRQPVAGRLSLRFDPKRLGQVVHVIEGATRS